MRVRSAESDEIDHLAQVWFDGWHDSHAQLVPAELTRLRTRENFRDRLQAALPSIRVVGARGAPMGFCIVRDDELYQLFVSAESRGSGVAAALIADAEARLAANGVRTAWLACAIGNNRAARFYEKCGWRRAGTMVNQAETAQGNFPLESWRYEKRLTSDSSSLPGAGSHTCLNVHRTCTTESTWPSFLTTSLIA
jgi:GNAT superfamily N-acetyltransferase